MYQIEHYLTATEQKDLYASWLSRLRDRQGQVAIIRRMLHVARGSFGDHKPCRDGVWELRIHAGPGYRVYYALAGKRVILLLCGGDKRTQDADINHAVACWQDWQQRDDHEKQTT